MGFLRLTKIVLAFLFLAACVVKSTGSNSIDDTLVEKTPTPTPTSIATPRPTPSSNSAWDSDEPWKDAGPLSAVGLTSYTGTYRANVEGMVVENLRVRGRITITANNVTVRNCLVLGDEYRGIYVAPNVKNALIEHNEVGVIGGSVNLAGISLAPRSTYTVRNNWIHHVRDGITFSGSGIIEKNIISDIYGTNEVPGDYHPDAIQSAGGISGVTIRKNKINISSYLTSAIIVSTRTDGPINNLSITENYLNGGGVTIYVRQNTTAPITNVFITNNRFGWDYEVRLISQDIGEQLHFDGNIWFDPIKVESQDANGVLRTNGRLVLKEQI